MEAAYPVGNETERPSRIFTEREMGEDWSAQERCAPH
jgi:hypothetical protein